MARDEDQDVKARRRGQLEARALANKLFDPWYFELWKPDWNTWRNIPKLKLWEAIALSCDIDPECLCNPFDGFTLDSVENTNLPEEFTRRMKIAMANLGETLKPEASFKETSGVAGAEELLRSPQPEALMILRLEEVGRFAVSVGWELPEAFPGANVEPVDESDARREIYEKELGERERVVLLRIIAALLREHDYDLTRLSKTADVLSQLTEGRGVRVASRTILNHLNRAIQVDK